MATSRDSIEMRLKLARAREFQRGTNKSARAVDNLGDQAAQAARKFNKLNRASSKTRVSLGPFTLNMKYAIAAVGGLTQVAQAAVPAVASLAEGIVTAGIGAGAAGAVGFTAFGQAAGVAALGLSDLTDAIGGNEEAMKKLSPQARDMAEQLTKIQNQWRVRTDSNLFPGLQDGLDAAVKNLPIVNGIISATADTLGDLGRDAGSFLGRADVGADIADMGARNVTIIDNLGHAGLNLADAARHILHEAGPLAEWLSKMVLRGSELADTWIANQRASGGLAKFFSEAKRDLKLIWSITSNLAGGVINLFGHDDVDGTKALASLDRITQKFEDWTKSIQDKDLGKEIVHQLVLGLGEGATFIGSHIGHAFALGLHLGWKAFMEADPIGKALIAYLAFKKLGPLIKGAGWFQSKIMGAADKAGKGLAERGATPANPLFVSIVGPGGVPGDPAGKGGWLGKTLGAAGRLGMAFIKGPAFAAAVFAAADYLTDKYVKRDVKKTNSLDPGGSLNNAVPAPIDSKGMRDWRRDAGLVGPNATQVPRGTPGLSPVPPSSAAPLSSEPNRPIVVDNTLYNIMPDGTTYKSTTRTVSKKTARRKARTPTAAGRRAASLVPGIGST